MADEHDVSFYLKHCKGEFEAQTRERKELEKKVARKLEEHDKHLTDIISKLDNGLMSTVKAIAGDLKNHMLKDEIRREKAEARTAEDRKQRKADSIAQWANVAAWVGVAIVLLSYFSGKA